MVLSLKKDTPTSLRRACTASQVMSRIGTCNLREKDKSFNTQDVSLTIRGVSSETAKLFFFGGDKLNKDESQN